MSLVAVVFTMMAPQQANAQFFKQLGKIAEQVGKQLLEDPAVTQAEQGQTQTEASTQVNGVKIVTGHPDLKIVVNRCAASGTNVVIDLVITNIGSTDVEEFKLHGSTYGTKVYDDQGNIYDKDIQVKIANREYTKYSDEIKLVAGVPTRVSFLIKGVAAQAKTFVLFEPDAYVPFWNITKETVKLRNIPITREN